MCLFGLRLFGWCLMWIMEIWYVIDFDDWEFVGLFGLWVG